MRGAWGRARRSLPLRLHQSERDALVWARIQSYPAVRVEFYPGALATRHRADCFPV